MEIGEDICYRKCQCLAMGLQYAVLLLAYFPKMKAGLSNHQSVCLCPPLTTSELLGGFSRNIVWR
jgi:hypothetical protein